MPILGFLATPRRRKEDSPVFQALRLSAVARTIPLTQNYFCCFFSINISLTFALVKEATEGNELVPFFIFLWLTKH